MKTEGAVKESGGTQVGVATLCVVCLTVAGRAPAQENAMPLIDFGARGVETRLDTTQNQGAGQVECRVVDGERGKALEVTIQPGPSGYPGVAIKPEGGRWDLSRFGHVEARIVNTGATEISPLSLRVDNAGDWRQNPWNTEMAWGLSPGEARTLTVIFGFQYGHKPGFPLKPEAVVNVLLFTGKRKERIKFRVDWIVAAGPPRERPPVDPASVRIRPTGGVLLGRRAGAEATVEIGRDTVPWKVASSQPPPDTAVEVDEKNGVRGARAGAALRITFPATTGAPTATLKPSVGRWDFRDACEVRVTVRNESPFPVTPRVQVLSDGGPTDEIAALALAPRAETEIVVPFTPAVPGTGGKITAPGFYTWEKGTGTTFSSDRASGIAISVAKEEGEATLLVKSILADAPPMRTPVWLGRRPPEKGDWVRTFADEFDGTSVDETRWMIYGPNYWDTITRWSRANAIVGGGVVRLRYEKKSGFHCDDERTREQGGYPTKSGSNRADYTCGFLETYGKWVQRYGYFEARLSLPRAPGLWPAFWLTPDRGVEVGPQWVRQNTGDGGMEFDILEHLTRWGPYRYNIAMHWDGYGKDHTAIGSQCHYVRPDADGFVAYGLLWLPGRVTYYANGVEMARWESARVSSVQSDMMLTFNAGGWDNNSLDDTKLPADLIIDYVRVWQRRDLASAVDGYRSAPGAPKGD